MQDNDSSQEIPNIRKAKLTDYSSINKLSVNLGYKSVSDDVARNRLGDLLKSKTDKVWVFVKQNQILGWIHVFIGYRVASSSFAEIGGIVVSPEDRRQGIGRSLVNHAKLWASDHDLKLRVRCNSKREESHEFYESAGFSKVKTQHVFECNLL